MNGKRRAGVRARCRTSRFPKTDGKADNLLARTRFWPFLAIAVIVCSSCASRVTGFLPPVPQTRTYRAAAAPRFVETILKIRSPWENARDCPGLFFAADSRREGPTELLGTRTFREQQRSTARSKKRVRWQTLGASMSGAGGRLWPGRGTQVVLLRHGMSTFNKLNIFTGWCDVPLAEEGRMEATEAGKLLAAAGYRFDVAHASVLKRACTSLHRLLDGCGQPYIPIKTDWRLNERHYGALQGRNKAKLEESMGDIVVEWRRGYQTRPPPMTDTHPHFPLISLDARYRGVTIPETESLADTADRVMEYWESEIVPDIRAGKRVIMVSHANTIRSLVKRLDGVAEDAIRHVNIPTGEPFVYNFDADLRPIGEPNEYGFRGKFVGDLMGEREAAVDNFKRREQACMSKWEENPEVVPEECYIDYDVDFGAGAMSGRFGEEQASLGLDRYSVGYDLPLPPFLPGVNRIDPGLSGATLVKEEVGAPVISDEETIEGFSEKAVAGREGGRRIPDRNETSSATTTTTVLP